jgi:hypothetical protein
MKSGLKLLLIVVGVAALTCASIIGYALWDFRERRVTLSAQTQQPLTEEQAVALSREALRRVGEDVPKFSARPYDGIHLYARNTITSYSGYVLLESADSRFSVHLDQIAGEVRCGVSRCK